MSIAADRAATAVMQAAGVHCIRIPTPFAVGHVNVYLLEDEPLTLIDNGPDWGTAWHVLERGLAACGHALDEVGLILLTHQQVDHLGLTGPLAGRASSEVACHETVADYGEHYDRAVAKEDGARAEIMRRHGASEELMAAVLATGVATHRWASGFDVHRRLASDSTVHLRDRTLHVFHRPGHSPSDTVFWDEERRLLFGGDHLLSDISANALVDAPPLGSHAGIRRRPLLEYRASLTVTREMDLELILTGHGPPVLEHRELIDRRYEEQESRASAILRLLRERAQPAGDLALRLFGDTARAQPFLTLSEVLGHLDLLVERGDAVAREDRDPIVYAAS